MECKLQKDRYFIATSLSDRLYFRMTFAAAQKEDLGEGVRIFAEVIKNEFSWD